MNARIREKQAAYLAAMGREPEAQDPRGVNVVELRAPGTDESDEVTVTYDNPLRVVHVRAKTTRRIIADICRELGRAPAQVIATPTKQGDFHSAWIKANDGPDAAEAGGQRLAFVTGITPTVINIVLGHRIDRFELVPGQQRYFGVLRSLDASRLSPTGRAQAEVEASTPEAQSAEPEPLSEPEQSGDDE
jgi:hypothetical protein